MLDSISKPVRVFDDQFATPENFDELIKREKWTEINE